MEDLRIHIAIRSRYQVLDASGQLPFSVVFGLCRRSPADTDARPIVLHTSNSTLDVPYALSQGLLTLHEQHEGDKQETQISLTGQSKTSDSESGEYLTLSSPVGRTWHWREAITVYQYCIDPKSELASVLRPGRKYTIRIASGNLGVKWWAYGNGDELLDKQRSPTKPSETAKLVNSKPSAGKANFAVVPELPWPPKVEVHMQLCRDEQSASDAGGVTCLEISLLNKGTEPIVVQTRGPQRFLVPWGPFQPDEAGLDSRPRVIDKSSRVPGLQVLDATTGEVVMESRKQRPCSHLSDSTVIPPPKLETLMTVMPGEPLIRRMDISWLLTGLPDGQYRVRMVPQGMWWCLGSSEEIADKDDDRLPLRLYRTRIPPLMMETNDFVGLKIENGRAV
ncbi:hypothetical protein F4782DRAFT_519812, partial [Xylaria castorea]